MVGSIVSRILHVVYPALIIGIALTAWSSSSLSDVRITHPIRESLHFLGNQEFSLQNTCNGDKIQNLIRSCSVSSDSDQLKTN